MSIIYAKERWDTQLWIEPATTSINSFDHASDRPITIIMVDCLEGRRVRLKGLK